MQNTPSSQPVPSVFDSQISVTDARQRISEIIDRVRYKQDTVMLMKSGKPAAVMVSVDLYNRWLDERRKRFAVIDEIQKNTTGMFQDKEVMPLALEAQKWVLSSQKTRISSIAKP